MLGKIVEVATDGAHLSIERGFLVVRDGSSEVGRAPIDDVSGVIGNAHGLTWSNNLLVGLAERSVPVVVCGRTHAPAAVLWPVGSHNRQGARMDGQLGATLPRKKRLWREIVRSKISMQAAVLDYFGEKEHRIRWLVRDVRAGDPGNVEGRAAAAYWPLLFGADFRRDRSAGGANALLNYGYAVLRATVARHLMAAGLHPGVPIHHKNESNPMRLVDDLMEPFRPLVDAWVRVLVSAGASQVERVEKRALALLPIRTLRGRRGSGPLTHSVQRLVTSLAQVYEGGVEVLKFPVASAESLRDFFDEPRWLEYETEAPSPGE